MIAFPPLLPAVNATSTEPLPASVIPEMVGADGIVYGVPVLLADWAPDPAPFIALSLKV